MHRKSASFVKLGRVRNFGHGIFFAHGEPFVINRTKPFFCDIFAGKNKIAEFVLSFDIKPLVCRIEKLHDFELFFCVSVKTVHVVAAFSAFFALSGDFIFHFFSYEIG